MLLLNYETGTEVMEIASKYHQDPKPAQATLDIIRQWMQGKGRPINWDELIHVLQDIGLMNLASEIEDGLRH